MHEISISVETREALVASLTRGCGPAPSAQETQNGSDKLFLGQLVSPIGVGRTGTFKKAHWDEIKQTLRDAMKDFAQTGTAGHMPHMQEAKEQFWKDWPKPDTSPLDSPKEQLLIGAIGGGAGAVVPGGPVVTQAMIDSGILPPGTQEAQLGKALAEVGIGGGQFFIGADATIIGGGLSLSGGGAVVGVPTCVAGISLATQGAITFCNGAKSLAIILCNWEQRPVAEAQPLAAVAPKDAVSSAPVPQSGGASTPAAPPAKPAAAPVQAAKPAANPSAPTGGQTPGQKPKHYGSGTNVSANTTSWVRCTGQVHHAISAKIHAALESPQNLKGIYKYRDNRFVTQALDKAAHNGYQKWHKSLDKEIVAWLEDNRKASMADFEAYLRQRYAKSDLKAAFPNGL